jgi:hypothetical protein
VRRKVFRFLQDVFERHIREPSKLDATAEWFELPLQLPQPRSFIGRNAIHNCDHLCVGQNVQEAFERSGEVVVGRHNGVVRGELVVLDPPRLYGREDHGGLRKKLRAIPLDEASGRGAEGNDEVGRRFLVESVKVIDKGPV